MNRMRYQTYYLSIFLILICSIFTMCKSTYSLKIDNVKYSELYIFNETDTLNGFYRVEKGNFYYISKWDMENRDSLCNQTEKKIEPYFLFSLNMDDTFSSQKKYCDIHPIYENLDFRNLRNIFYRPERINDTLYSVRHVAIIYNDSVSFQREFIINSKLEILEMKTTGKKNEIYFYYD